MSHVPRVQKDDCVFPSKEDEHSHLSNRAGYLRPYGVDLGVEALEGKRLQRRVWLGQEAHQTGGRREANHDAMPVGLLAVSSCVYCAVMAVMVGCGVETDGVWCLRKCQELREVEVFLCAVKWQGGRKGRRVSVKLIQGHVECMRDGA